MAFDFNSIDVDQLHSDYIDDAVSSVLVEQKSVLNVIREQLGITSLYGFKETDNISLKRKIYAPSRPISDPNKGTIGNTKRACESHGWKWFSKTDINTFIKDYQITTPLFGKDHEDPERSNKAKLIFSDFIDNDSARELLGNICNLDYNP